MIYPITFCIPEIKIAKNVLTKEKKFGTIIPGNSSTYIFKNEIEYRNDYAKSVFGLTKCKGGWDCLRHYEIMASGTIPYFENLQNCPVNTMTHLPKKLILEAMSECINNYNYNSDKIIEYSQKILDYVRTNLSTKAMAQYIIKSIGINDINNILYLSSDISPDYMRCLLLHGFKELYNKNCHDYPCIPHLYTDMSEHDSYKLYGKGFTYTRLLDKELTRDSNNDTSIENDIMSHKYDLIIYGSCHRGIPFWDLVNKYYNKNEIILVCGEDLHNCEMINKYKDYNLFIREL
jgi:hypothetical protein